MIAGGIAGLVRLVNNMIMTKCSLAAFAATIAGFILLLNQGAPAQGTALRVLASNGVRGAMGELQPACEREIGRPLAVQFSSTAALKKRIEAGEAFDVTIITAEALNDLEKQGRIAGASRVRLGRSELGIGIRAGALKPDIRTTDALKATLRTAKSITFPQDGATRGDIEKMLERLGIATEVKPRIILAPSSGAATESVAEGKAAMVITLFSEIVPVDGVEILGALPGEFARHVSFEAAASTATKNGDAAKALIAFLTGQKTAPMFRAKGVDRR